VNAAYAGLLRLERSVRKASKASQLRVARRRSCAANRKQARCQHYQAAHRPNETQDQRPRAPLKRDSEPKREWHTLRKWIAARLAVRCIAWLGLWGRRWKWTDFHGLNQPMRKGEPMAHVLIGKNCSSQVAHDLMNVD